MGVRMGTKSLQEYGSDLMKSENTDACLLLQLLYTSCSRYS